MVGKNEEGKLADGAAATTNRPTNSSPTSEAGATRVADE